MNQSRGDPVDFCIESPTESCTVGLSGPAVACGPASAAGCPARRWRRGVRRSAAGAPAASPRRAAGPARRTRRRAALRRAVAPRAESQHEPVARRLGMTGGEHGDAGRCAPPHVEDPGAEGDRVRSRRNLRENGARHPLLGRTTTAGRGSSTTLSATTSGRTGAPRAGHWCRERRYGCSGASKQGCEWGGWRPARSKGRAERRAERPTGPPESRSRRARSTPEGRRPYASRRSST